MSRLLTNHANGEAEIRTSSLRTHDLQRARRLGMVPSVNLRKHFIALARRINQWALDNVQLAQKHPITIGVTGLNRRVGKSTVAFNLATSLAAINQDDILLVEADFGKNKISRRLGHHGAVGLSDVLQGQSELDECVLQTPLGGVGVMGSGTVSEQLAVELPFDRLASLVDDQFGSFGYSIFDLPVATDLTPCFSLASQLDGVVLAVDAKQLDQRQIARVKRRFEEYGVEIIGLVLNKA